MYCRILFVSYELEFGKKFENFKFETHLVYNDSTVCQSSESCPKPGVSFEILNYLISYSKIKTSIRGVTGADADVGTVDPPTGLFGEVCKLLSCLERYYE